MDAPAPARTLDYGDAATAATVAHPASGVHPTALAATALAGEGPVSAAVTLSPASARTTVLPRIEGDGAGVRLLVEQKTRYEPRKLLGAGGMGEVLLVDDQDIARPVAVKRLLPDMTSPALLARFVDEIRIVGRLEHPNIVPIHDVGVDELGRYFFVMKYVEGETLESIIDKLAAGDPGYHRAYTYERRIEIFLGVLRALEYAHEHGVLHRDVKPANVMVGRYGEVVLMDWGVAKAAAATRDPAAGVDGDLGEGRRGRVFATRVGSIIGTPAYMSPEQARGENDRVDERCDLYSATVLFYELVCLRHPLAGATTMETVLSSVATKQWSVPELFAARHPDHIPPSELMHFIHKGLALDPERRFQTAREMIEALQNILEGKCAVQCHATFTKRTTRELGRLVDRHPHLGFAALLGVVFALLFAAVEVVRLALTMRA